MPSEQLGPVMLKVDDINMYFGKVAALSGVSFDVREGEIHSIIGPNGAGKTVLLNCINGLYHPQKGSIPLKGRKSPSLNPITGPNWGFPGPSRRSNYLGE